MDFLNVQPNFNYSSYNNRTNIPETLANSMPNGLLRISQPSDNKNIEHNLKNSDCANTKDDSPKS